MEGESTIEAEDLARLLGLLKEYTTKLREICEERSASRYRLFAAAAVAVTVIVTAVATLSAFLIQADFGSTQKIVPLTLATFGLVTVVMLVFTLASTSSRFKYWYDAKQVSATVERLIKTASQYSEHASKRIGDKFEFDLRLAEAEAALHMYKKLFEQTTNGFIAG